jgi:prolyl 4-hydroxylase
LGLNNKYRTGYDFYVQKENNYSKEFNEIINVIKGKVSDVTCFSILNQEDMSIIRYCKGEYYKDHHDFFPKNKDYYNEKISEGGQRIWSSLICLKEAENGGETNFPLLGIKIKLKLGDSLFWHNVIDRKPLNKSLHSSLPVIEGEKWVAAIRIRENLFKNTNNL